MKFEGLPFPENNESLAEGEDKIDACSIPCNMQ